jgi:hypothetical protein
VRKKPLSIVQLDLFGENFNERMLYVRSSKKGKASFPRSFEADVFGCSSVDSSNECSQRANEGRFPPLN